MSEYISRNRFGPLLITLDALGPSSLSLRVDSTENALLIEDSGDESEGGITSVGIREMPIRDIIAMLEWLRDECIKQTTIRFTIDVVQEHMQSTFDSAFADDKPYTLRDQDHMSFQVGLREHQEIDLQANAEGNTNG